MKITPKNCPICGNPAEIFRDGYTYKVKCSNSNCHKSLICAGNSSNELLAVELWNETNEGGEPCPFCGHNAGLRYGHMNMVVYCENRDCFVHSSIAHFDTKRALEIWNTRAWDTNVKVGGKDG